MLITEDETTDRQWRAIRFAVNVLKLQGLQNVYPTEMTIVWFENNDENWKAVVESRILEGTQYAVSYDAEKNTASVDIYQRYKSVNINDEVIDLGVI